MPNAKNDGEWFRCAICGHKLGKVIGDWGDRSALPAVEIKCHSCKTMNYVWFGKDQQEKESQ